MSDKQQTALQQLIEWNNSKDRYSMITWIELDAKLKEILPIEKQQIIDARVDGGNYARCCSLIPKDIKDSSEQYFNETFKTESNGTT